MNNAESVRACLERLTTRELARMADREGIDIPPDLDRIFIIQELLEQELMKDGEDPPFPEMEAPPPGKMPVPLPRHYNITWLEILPRDPLWAFAFWEIKAQDRERFEAAAEFNGYCLRASLTGAGAAFTVPVGGDDNAWYLGFPPRRGEYTVELCVSFRGETRGLEEPVYKTLAASAPFTLPRGAAGQTGWEEIPDNPLIRLSGAACFSPRLYTSL
jgi:hypothetical protein